MSSFLRSLRDLVVVFVQKMAKPTAEHKKEEVILKEFFIERVKCYEAIWAYIDLGRVPPPLISRHAPLTREPPSKITAEGRRFFSHNFFQKCVFTGK
jgi:hypothetical protein